MNLAGLLLNRGKEFDAKDKTKWMKPFKVAKYDF